MRKQWVLTLLADLQADEKTDIAEGTSLLISRKQLNSINQENRQPAVVAASMISYLHHQPDHRVDLKPGIPKIRTETVTIFSS